MWGMCDKVWKIDLDDNDDAVLRMRAPAISPCNFEQVKLPQPFNHEQADNG